MRTHPYDRRVPSVPITVETAESRTELRRFAEMPYVLHHHDDRWSPGVRAFEQWRLDTRRHPYFERGDATFLLARRGGRPVGRIAAHVAERPATQGRFGFLAVPDDPAVTAALVGAAVDWLTERGVRSLSGPLSWDADEELGVLVAGHEHPGATGRPWHPPWYAEHLAAAGLRPDALRLSHRLATSTARAPAAPPGGGAPPHAGRFADPALVVDGAAAVPDVSVLLRDASLRNAWAVARAARHRAFTVAVCVRCDDAPESAVPGLLAAAGAAGYEWLLAPWAPPGTPPETIHHLFVLDW